MIILLIYFGGALLVFLLGVLTILARRRSPRSFRGDLKLFEKDLFNHLAGSVGEPVGGLVLQQLPYLRRGVRLYKLVNDPMERLDVVTEEYYQEGEKFEGALGELAQKYPLSAVQRPLPERQKELFIKRTNTKLPADLLELFDQTNGFTLGEMTVSGLGHMQYVSLEDSSYLMIAEKTGGCLAIRVLKRKTDLRYYSYEDESDVRSLGDSFLVALDLFMRI